jgi:hypothetical protein
LPPRRQINRVRGPSSLKGPRVPGPGRRRLPHRAEARTAGPRRPRRTAPAREPGRDPTSAQVPPETSAPRPRRARHQGLRRRPAPLRHPAPPPAPEFPGPGKPTAPPRRVLPPRRALPGTRASRRPRVARHAGFRRFRRPRPLSPARGLRAAPPARRGFPDRRGPRSHRPTSGARATPVPRRQGPDPTRPQGRAEQRAQAPGLTGGVREPPRPGRLRPGRQDPAPRARVLPGPAYQVPVPVLRVPARGRATTRSARPRPAWDRRPRRGRRLPADPARRLTPGRDSKRVPAGRAVPVRVADADRAGPRDPMDRARGVTRVRGPAARGRAR